MLSKNLIRLATLSFVLYGTVSYAGISSESSTCNCPDAAQICAADCPSVSGQCYQACYAAVYYNVQLPCEQKCNSK